MLLSDMMEPMPTDSTRDTVATPAVDLATLPGVYRAPETPWNIWQIVAKNGRLHDVVPDTSFPMTRLRNGQYYSDGVFYRFTASGSGKTAHMTFTARDVREELDRAPNSRLWQPQPSTLRALTGTFYSAESGAIWEIAIDRGELVLRRPGAADTPLTPVVPGWFFGNLRLPDASTSIGLEFPRGTTSASHFMMTALPNFEIVRNLRFDRVGRP